MLNLQCLRLLLFEPFRIPALKMLLLLNNYYVISGFIELRQSLWLLLHSRCGRAQARREVREVVVLAENGTIIGC